MLEQRPSAQWDFIVSLYAKPEIRDVCLALQKIGGVDIPILLAALYATARGNIQLVPNDIREMDILVAPLREDFVYPLRAMRTKLKNPTSQLSGSETNTLRTKILEAELLAEREQLTLLDHYFSGKAPSSAGTAIDATLNLVGHYYFEKGAIDEGAASKIMSRLVIFPEAIASLK